MSGAFNIDVEVGPAEEKQSQRLKFYCASLTETWVDTCTGAQLNVFRRDLTNEPYVKKHKIVVPTFDAADLNSCEQFLSQLGCTAAVLRVERFHNFLKVPAEVRKGLLYASHKPFGKTIREGFMQKHPRYVRKGVNKRFIRLTGDERGGSLVSYLDESKKIVLASLKIGASTTIQSIADSIKDAFVVKSGKRQWVLQATSTREYNLWQSAIMEILKQFGPVSIGKNAKANIESPESPTSKKAPTGAAANKLSKANEELRVQVDRSRALIESLRAELRELHEEAKDAEENDVDSIRRKVMSEFARDKDNLIRDYELQHENLRSEIEDLHRQLEAKTAMEAGSSGLKTMFADGFSFGTTEDEYNAEIDTEKRYLDGLTEDEKQSIKFVHKHLHRHDHKHIHHHRHEHFHYDSDDPPKQVTQTHTISHTITHTNTQFKIKKSFF